MRRWKLWNTLRRRITLPAVVLAITVCLVCMTMAEMHAVMLMAAQGSSMAEINMPAAIVNGIVLLALTALILERCESCWLKPAKLDWGSFRRSGWTWSRTIIVALSLLLTLSAMRNVAFAHLSMTELQLLLAVACGYAMWVATVMSLLYALANSIDLGGGDFQGAFVPLGPLNPLKQKVRAMIPA